MPCYTLIAILLLGCEATWCSAGDITLRFPEDRPCGTVFIGPQPTTSRGWTKFFDQRQRNDVHRAIGSVILPQGAFVTLSLNRSASIDLSFLNSLPADAIHQLYVQSATLGSAEIASLSRFTGLRQLTLVDCSSSTELDVAAMPPALALESLNYAMSNVEGRKALAAWAAKCPKLQYIYDRGGPFDLSTVRLFKGHPSVEFVTVDFDANAADVVSALNDIPRLRALNVNVETDDCLAVLSTLKHLELLNWNGGQIDAATLRNIGQLPKLRTLRFSGTTKLQADFAKGLSYLAALEELRLSPSENECTSNELQAGLCSLKRLRDWPEVHAATSQTLESMATRGDLREIAIAGLSPDASIEQVVRLCKVESLETVELSGIPFTAELGEALSRCSKLRELRLDVESFDGNNLKHPERFASLELCSLVVHRNASNLSALAGLPSLRDLSLSVESFEPVDYGFVSQSPSLMTFSTRSNCVTDETIQQIAGGKNLVRISLGEHCILSDEGLSKLAKSRQLREISVGGNVSAVAIRHLDTIPNLSSLSISSLLPEGERESLQLHFKYLEFARFDVLESSFGDPLVGPDGLWRENDPEWRKTVSELEGKSLRNLMGTALSEAMEMDLRGKVVLVDFWGTWCGPCVALLPDLQRFHGIYGEDGFAIVGIHSERGADKLDDYLKKNTKPWPNLPDAKGDLAASFAVPHYPGLYLFDRRGKLRVAIPFRPKLESSIKALLHEARE